MRFFIFVLVSFLALTSPSIRAESPPLEIKDIYPDQPINCEIIKTLAGERQGAGRACEKESTPNLFFKSSFLGGTSNFLVRMNERRIVSGIMITNFDFNKAVTSFEAKFGNPVIEESVVQNRMGASFNQKIAIWNQGSIVLRISLHGSKLGESNLFLSGKTAIEEINQKQKPSDDL